MSVSDVVAWISATISLASVAAAGALYRVARRTETREATSTLMLEWWGKEMRELRRYYRVEFAAYYSTIDPDSPQLSFRQLEQLNPTDDGRLRALCYFFDRVGWLGAVGLVDVDYILAAFQHYVIEVWEVLGPFIYSERQPLNLNPIFMSGFEWLYKRSGMQAGDQAHLIRSHFRRPRLITRGAERDWRERITEAETLARNDRASLTKRTGGGKRPNG